MMVALLLAGAGVRTADRTPAAAGAAVVRYYDAIEHGRYRTAFQLWSDNGAASGQSYAAFTRGFARTAHTRVVAGSPTDSEGAAGSAFTSVPVTVTATLKDGTRQRFRGAYVLCRVNDVSGATVDQHSWHIASARLRRF